MQCHTCVWRVSALPTDWGDGGGIDPSRGRQGIIRQLVFLVLAIDSIEKS